MELDENLQKYFKIFEAAPLENKASDGKSVPHYFLWGIELDPTEKNDYFTIFCSLFFYQILSFLVIIKQLNLINYHFVIVYWNFYTLYNHQS